MTPYRHNRLTIIAISALFLAILGYAYYEGLPLLRGPSIVLNLPTETIATSDPYVRIEGSAERITRLLLNGREVVLTEGGSFTEDILLSEGYNELTFLAVDQTGRETTQMVHVLYTPTQEKPAPAPLSP